jgi:hypothetical protein
MPRKKAALQGRGSCAVVTGLRHPLPVVAGTTKPRPDAHQVQGFFVRKRPKRFFARARVRVQVGFCRFENFELARQYAKNLFFSCSVIAAP